MNQVIVAYGRRSGSLHKLLKNDRHTRCSSVFCGNPRLEELLVQRENERTRTKQEIRSLSGCGKSVSSCHFTRNPRKRV
jgi:hypothetical protein